MNNTLVSIAVTTYNQQDYIAQTMDGLLMQQTNFKFVIVVGEDCSTDNTIQILETYKKKNPSKIQLLNFDKNYGSDLNLLRTIKACTGKFIAICDGDDYWIDTHKLQKQVDFLESNEGYGTVATLQKDFIQDKGIFIAENNSYTETYKTIAFKQLLFKNYITASTVLFRRSLMLSFIDFYEKQNAISFNDYNFFLFFAHQMQVAQRNEISIVYRVLSESGSRSKDAKKIWSFKKRFNNAINIYLDFFDVDSKLKKKVLHYRAITNYRFASRSGDRMVCTEFLEVFKNNNDTIRYFLLKNGMEYKAWNRFALFVEKVNLKFGGFLLKKVEI